MRLLKRVKQVAAGLRQVEADKLSQLRQVDEHATNLVSGYRNKTFLGLRIFPIVPVNREAGKFTEFGPSPFFTRDKLANALGTPRVRLEYTTATGTYITNRADVEVPIYDRELDEIADSDRDAFVEKKSMMGEDVVQLAMEYEVASIISDPTQYASGFAVTLLSGSTSWKNAGSTPISDIRTGVRKLATQLGVGYSELRFAVSPKAFEALSDHSALLSRIQYNAGPNSPAVLTLDALAGIFGVGGADMLSAQYPITIDPLDPTATVYSFLWGDVFIIYLPIAKPTFADPLAGAVVRRAGYPWIDGYRDPKVDADMKVTRDNWGVVVRKSASGQNRLYLITNASALP
jgi:hypothetical protein